MPENTASMVDQIYERRRLLTKENAAETRAWVLALKIPEDDVWTLQAAGDLQKYCDLAEGRDS